MNFSSSLFSYSIDLFELLFICGTGNNHEEGKSYLAIEFGNAPKREPLAPKLLKSWNGRSKRQTNRYDFFVINPQSLLAESHNLHCDPMQGCGFQTSCALPPKMADKQPGFSVTWIQEKGHKPEPLTEDP